jgi:hypothetical protein
MAEVILMIETELKSEPYNLKSTDVICYSVQLCENITAGKPNPHNGMSKGEQSFIKY